MRRSVLLTLAALGGLICLIGGTGLFAALTDSARSATNSVETAPLASAADIQLATATPPESAVAGEPVECGTFTENLDTPFFTVANAGDEVLQTDRYYCVKNVGSQAVDLEAMVDELTDLDVACTGDEAVAGDVSCGDNGAGELAGQLWVRYQILPDCAAGFGQNPQDLPLPENGQTPVRLATELPPGQVRCFELILFRISKQLMTDQDRQRAQSDRVTWRFKWIAHL